MERYERNEGDELMLRIKLARKVRSGEKGPPYANFYFAAMFEFSVVVLFLPPSFCLSFFLSFSFRPRGPLGGTIGLYLYSRLSDVHGGALSGLISFSHSIFTGGT